MANSQHPYFSFFPALPLLKTFQLGDWCIGKPGADVAWRSARFKELALTHLKAFAKEGFKDGALMWHQERGFDGSMPEPQAWSAIQAAVCFAALDANDHVRNDLNAVHYVTTSENAELFTQPIDEERAFITHQRGGRLKHVLSGGWKIGEEMVSLPDAVVAVSQPVIASQYIATAVFNALLDTSKSANRRIAVALEWHRFALSNPRVVSWPQRIVALKTGFEALSGGESKTHLCGQFLRQLFENTTMPHVSLLPWAGILWSPKERTDLSRSWMKGTRPQSVVRSELEDWFNALGEARNEIIHEGTFSKEIYDAPPERPLSRYAGPLFWTADRVLREAVKAMLGVEVLLCARLKEAEDAAKLGAILRAMMDREAMVNPATSAKPEDDSLQPDPDDIETASPEVDDDFDVSNGDSDNEINLDPSSHSLDNVTRDLGTLLSALKCDAANKVRLQRVIAQPSASIEAADANARAVRGRWGASFEKRSLLINRAERDLLEATGAEFSLPNHWSRCD